MAMIRIHRVPRLPRIKGRSAIDTWRLGAIKVGILISIKRAKGKHLNNSSEPGQMVFKYLNRKLIIDNEIFNLNLNLNILI